MSGVEALSSFDWTWLKRSKIAPSWILSRVSYSR